jgi:hypothetical protein
LVQTQDWSFFSLVSPWVNLIGTWEVVDLPPGQKAIGSDWVFKVKHNQDGSIERFKARLVAKGYSQRPGLDYNESFAPTFCPATLHIIMALAAVEDFALWISHLLLPMVILMKRST